MRVLIFFINSMMFFMGYDVKSQQTIKNIEKVNDIQNAYTAWFAPDDNTLVYTKENFRGLFLYDFDSKNTITITESQGAGFDPLFRACGRQIIYKTYISGEKGIRLSNFNLFEISTGKSKLLTPYIRNLSSARLKNNFLVYSENTELQAINLGTKTKSSLPGFETVAFTDENLNLVLVKDGNKIKLNPLGDAFYIWVSLSPDGKMILYNVPGKGSYISNLNGVTLYEIGKLNAVKWSPDGKYVIGMVDEDDGKRYLKSDIVIFSLFDRGKTILTEKSDIVALNPDLSSDGKKIVFNDDKGNIYLIHLD